MRPRTVLGCCVLVLVALLLPAAVTLLRSSVDLRSDSEAATTPRGETTPVGKANTGDRDTLPFPETPAATALPQEKEEEDHGAGGQEKPGAESQFPRTGGPAPFARDALTHALHYHPATEVFETKGEKGMFARKEHVYVAGAHTFRCVWKAGPALRGQVGVAHYASVCGGLEGLEYLLYLPQNTLKTITFFDVNPYQIDQALLTFELILLSGSPRDFLTRVYSRNLTRFVADHGRITEANQMEYLTRPYEPEILTDTVARLSPQVCGKTKPIHVGGLRMVHFRSTRLWLDLNV
eukprot:TRINITY_DN68664_c0_g1_i1.p1 TRINITY_DN68664_c0_g1~~TRINITY_DN68664_c0_g1_i1.p1  ORF type:complete len:293 (+),score=35.19 TRINITY_DN68664_c0_g1_i1:87-965(+)